MKIVEEYTRKHGRSRELYEEAKTRFPSGVTHDARYLEPFPLYMDRGEGARKWDVDGNEYLCYVMGHGALILGHSHPEIVKAVNEQIVRGTHLGSSTERELGWADAVKRLVPSVERIRFCSSGTEATLMAVRLARAYTGKTRILLFNDHFHGWHDCVVQETGKWSSGGVPRGVYESVTRLPAGDIDGVDRALEERGDVAAVMLEPTGASMGCYPIRPSFVRGLREVTELRGALLVFDEVVTGFRVSPGGAQASLGVRPDLTVMAKVLAGGLPGGAVGGRAEVMDMIAFRGDSAWDQGVRVSHPGTFNANPLSAAAGTTCLELLARRPVNRSADAAAARLKDGLNLVLRGSGVKGVAYGNSSLVWVLLGVGEDEGFGEASLGACAGPGTGAGEGGPGSGPRGGPCDPPFFGAPHDAIRRAVTSGAAQVFKRAMLNEGVDIMGTSEFIVSAAHGEREIDGTLERFERALTRMKGEGELP